MEASSCDADRANPMGSAWIEISTHRFETKWVRRFRCEDNNASNMHMKPQYYHVNQVESFHILGVVSRRYSSVIGLLRLCLSYTEGSPDWEPTEIAPL